MPLPPIAEPSTPAADDEPGVKEKLALLDLIQEVTHTGTWAWDLASGRVTWSRELERIYGYTDGSFPEDYRGFADRVFPEDLLRLEADRTAAIAAHRGFQTDFRIRLPSGETRWLYSAGAAEYDADGQPLRVIGINVDITDRKRMEEALEESEKRYRGMVEDQTEVLARVRADGTFIHANEAFCRLYGKTLQELRDAPWQPTTHPDDVALVEERLGLLSPTNPVVMCENRVLTRDGEVRWMQYANRGFYDRNGRLLEIQAVGRDITAQKSLAARKQVLLEENTRLGHELIRLQERERRDLARDLHDELSQQLAAIRIHAAVIRRGLEGGAGGLNTNLDAIDSSAREIYAVTHHIMEGLHPQILDSAGLVEALQTWLAAWSGKHPGVHVCLRTAGAIEPMPAEARIHLYRIAQECLTNAASHGTASRVRIHLGPLRHSPTPWLRMVVRDNGIGPTTDATATGNGLIYMRERALALGGRLDVSRGAAGGLRVAVEIPVAAAGD